MRFVVIDVETANPELSSICQIGLVVFEDGIEVESWSVFIDPKTWFSLQNVKIHGINENTVKDCPTFFDILPTLQGYLSGHVVVSHTVFDRNSITQALAQGGHPPISCTWLDSASVARRAWEQFAYSGYGLKNLANFLGIEFLHHDALEDARATGKILLSAIEVSGIMLEEWVENVNTPIMSMQRNWTTNNPQIVKLDGNPDGHLFGEEVVFTGELSLSRREIAEIAARAGCNVSPSIKKKTTTLLVVGDQDPQRLRSTISTKQQKAEELIQQGKHIKILTEKDFLVLLQKHDECEM